MSTLSTPQAPPVAAPPLSEATTNNTNSTDTANVPPPDVASANTVQPIPEGEGGTHDEPSVESSSTGPEGDTPVSPIAQLDALLGTNYGGGADDAEAVEQVAADLELGYAAVSRVHELLVESYNTRRQQTLAAYEDFLDGHPELFNRDQGFSDVGRVFHDRLNSLYDYEAKRMRLPIDDALYLAYGFAFSWHLATSC